LLKNLALSAVTDTNEKGGGDAKHLQTQNNVLKHVEGSVTLNETGKAN